MAGGFSIVITAVDKATGTFDGLNKRLDALNKQIALARAPFDRLGESFTKFTKVTGFDKIATGFTNVVRAGKETFRSLLRVIEPLAAITGAASIAGLYRLATAWGQFGTILGQQATRAGLTATKLQNLQDAARLAGISAETLTSGMTSLNDNMRNAAYGGAPQFIQALQALGLNYDEIKKKTPTEALGIFADKIAAIKNPTDQAMVATALFGGAAEGMLPFLRLGAKGMAEMEAEAARLNPALGEDGVAAANAFRMSQTRLQLAVEGAGNAISSKLGPAVGPLLDQMANWIAANQQWLATNIAEYARQFGDYLKRVPWAEIGADIRAIAHDAQAVADALGGWQAVGEGVLAFFVGRFLIQMLLPFAKIAVALRALPAEAATAAAAANLELGTVGAAGFVGGLLGKLGVLGMALGAWEGLNATQESTRPDQDGLGNLLHNMLFDMNPAHWTQSYRPGAVGGGGGGGGGGGPIVIPSKGEQQSGARAMMQEFQNAGYTREASAAMVGAGAMAESTMNMGAGAGTAHQGGFQWEDARRIPIERQFGKPVTSMSPAESARAAIWELQHRPELAGLNMQMQTSHDGMALSDMVTERYERPGNYGMEDPRRQRLTQGVLQMPDGAPVDPPKGEGVAPPPSSGLTGAPGANGKVDMNIKVDGGASVSANASEDVGVRIERRNVARDGY